MLNGKTGTEGLPKQITAHTIMCPGYQYEVKGLNVFAAVGSYCFVSNSPSCACMSSV